jgi:hypothetical protein
MIPIKTIKILIPRGDFKSEDQESKVQAVVQALQCHDKVILRPQERGWGEEGRNDPNIVCMYE